MPIEVVLGRYELGEVLGVGGSAIVYRGRDRRTERGVALKRFFAGVDGPDRLRQHREVRTLARLDHRGRVRLLDAGTEHGRAHLVTDLVEGPTLARRLEDGPLPVAEVVELGAVLADALAYIHAEEVTHRDIKPANVLLDPDDGPRLADFGIALVVDATRVTASDAVVGTAAYMAPEQLRGGPVGAAADVYALGLVLLEAATGEIGLPGVGLEPVLSRLTMSPRIPDGLPPGLRALLQAMTDLRVARRPSAHQVASRLWALGEGSPETAVVSRRPGLPSAVRRRLRTVLAGVVGLVAVAAVALGVVRVLPHDAGLAPPVAVTVAPSATTAPGSPVPTAPSPAGGAAGAAPAEAAASLAVPVPGVSQSARTATGNAPTRASSLPVAAVPRGDQGEGDDHGSDRGGHGGDNRGGGGSGSGGSGHGGGQG
jgi:eukaryotic-like serine/threonine-protein kinase